MYNFFNFNLDSLFGMGNWFIPNYSFQNMFSAFQMPLFNFSNTWFNFPYQGTSPSLFSDILSRNDNNTNTNVDTFVNTNSNYAKNNSILSDYNSQKGERLAKIALQRSPGMWTGYCARYVKNSIAAANLGSYKYGHAYQMSDILRNNSNFKEVSPDNVEVSSLPAGCVLVYDKDTEGYSKKYGHTEITTGDKKAVSDGITKNLYKKPSAIFIPV